MTSDTERYRLTYDLTPEAMVATTKLAYAGAFRLVWVGVPVALALSLVTLLLGLWIPALLVTILSLSVALFASDPAQRWYMRREARSLIGRRHETGFGEDGLHETSPTGTSVILWSAITDIRENDEVVLFMRDRLPVVFVPVSAFETPAQRAEIVGYARERINEARTDFPEEGSPT